MFRSVKDILIPKKSEEDDATVDKLYTCDFCSEGWASETEVEIHRADHHKHIIANYMRNQLDHVCKMCITVFDSEDTLLRHIKSDHLLSSETAIRVERDIFICDNCDQIFFNKAMLAHHMYYTHMEKKYDQRIKCPICSRTVRLLSSWYHFRSHKLQSIACCKICCKKFRDRQQLGAHLKTHQFHYKCDICRYDTLKEDLFRTHIHKYHKKSGRAVRPDFKQYFVPQRYSSKWKLKCLMGWRGVRLSNNVSICVLCREICTDLPGMERHISLDHSDKEPVSVDYRCLCGLQFSSKVLLKHHIFKMKELDVDTVFHSEVLKD